MPEPIQQTNAEEPTPSFQDAQTDWWLAVLVRLANKGVLSFGITLSVSGVMVSGTLAGGKEYFDATAELMSRGAADDESRDSLRKSFATPGEIYEKDIASEEETPEGDEPTPPPTFVHLKDARFWSPGNSVPFTSQRGIWWRGRLAAVDGFFLGEPGWPEEAS
jgi:hypothetical protein